MARDDIDREAALGHLRGYLLALGIDLGDAVLGQSPERILNGHLEMLKGEGVDPLSVLSETFPAGHEEMVILKDLAFSSLCEHHFLPFRGVAHVAYIPNSSGRITGLSNIARLVDVLASRLQVQERLTTEIARYLELSLHPRGVLVVIEATHGCVVDRGVRKVGSTAVTSAVRGAFRNDGATRAEAIELLRLGGSSLR
ncbi:MAG: GTP cyclohydrolase I [Acidimicrobiales bacterium]